MSAHRSNTPDPAEEDALRSTAAQDVFENEGGATCDPISEPPRKDLRGTAALAPTPTLPLAADVAHTTAVMAIRRFIRGRWTLTETVH